MATRVIDDNKLNNIATAIQTKDNGGQMTVDEMPTRIGALPTAPTLIPKTITENGVYNAISDNADGYDVVTVDVPDENTLEKLCLDTLEVADISNVANVPDKIFFKKNSLVNVIMPNAITIGVSAFEKCPNLTLAVLPSGITSIADRGFTDCPNLTLAVLPSGITSFPESVFRRCTNLALTSLPNGVTSIGPYVFSTCTNLALTSLPTGVTNIERYAFEYCTGISYLDFSEFMQIPRLDVGVFRGTTFPFYFRDQQQLDEWAAATNWSTYADRFQIKN